MLACGCGKKAGADDAMGTHVQEGRKGKFALVKTFGVGDSLREESGLAQYDGFTVSEINVNGYVTFLNGMTIRRGEVIGDTNELNMQRVQIRETIMSHFEKERQLFKRGIKCLSLFFIDEVAKYKSYDEEGNEVKGVFQKMFEEEYSRLVSNEFHIWDEDYNEYLRRFYPQDVHCGYFSIDKKTNRIIVCVQGRCSSQLS